MLKQNKKKAFTLIELLVVIAIITILATLLMPALGKAKELARQTACTANLRNIGTAFNIYTAENDSALPGVAYANCFDITNGNFNGTLPWTIALAEHFGSYNLGVCPSDTQKACMSKIGKVGSYEDFFQMRFPNDPIPSSCAEAAQKWPWSYASNNNLGITATGTSITGRITLADIVKPSKCFFVTEFGMGSGTYSSWYVAGFGYKAPYGHWGDGARHSEGRSFILTDGHAEYVKDPIDPYFTNQTAIRQAYEDIGLCDVADGEMF